MRIAWFAPFALLAAWPAMAQMDHSAHGGHGTHGAAPPPEPAATSVPLPQAPSPPPPLPPAADPHAGHAMHATPDPGPAATGTAPFPPGDWAADAIFPAAAMRAARERMLDEHGGARFAQLMINIAEIAPGRGPNRYRWNGEGWFGGDLDRLVIKSEGDGAFGRSTESAEAQLVYARALDPYWNLQVGIRQDLGAGPSRRYAAIGIEGLAPYWFELDGTLFLSDRGRVSGRIEASYDQRITQRLIAQPRAEIALAAQSERRDGIGSGITDIELGLRLRYEITRAFAPYLGFSWDRKLGGTARLARRAGEDAGDSRLVAGLRFWL